MMNNPMICDVKTGVCGAAGEEDMQIIDFTKPKKTVDLYYVTDPICSHCWALEPVLRMFVMQYGEYFRFHVVMGGLLKSWDGFADAGNGISKPADVAEHWREVGEYSRMPIDGSLWHNNPIQSSYPPSRVFKVIQKHDESLAANFLRRAREAVFAFNQNIGDRSVLINLVNDLGLNGQEIVEEAESVVGDQLLQEDFSTAAELGVRGFPTIIMVNEDKKGVRIVGARSLDVYVSGLQQLVQDDQLQAKSIANLPSLLEKEKLLFSKELEVLYDLEPSAIDHFVKDQLPKDQYDAQSILGETYYQMK